MEYPFQINSFEEYNQHYALSLEDPALFWSQVAQNFHWRKPWDSVSKVDMQEARFTWFEGGQLNITENCLDRHLEHHAHEIALIWEPNDPRTQNKQFTYAQLHKEVCLTTEMLRTHGIQKGDRVCIYMGMVPELAITMLACARIGAIHSIIFGGFSAQSIIDRTQDAHAEYIVTCDGSNRGEKQINLKNIVDEALLNLPFVKKVIVFQHISCEISMKPNRDFWWHESMAAVDVDKAIHTPATSMNAEDPLFILYTSGSTGKPKGVVHSCAGYMIYATYTFVNVFQYKAGQIHFCTADIGWITGHSYIVYGPLCAGATTLMFEGIPTWPDAARFWNIVEKHKVNILYTAPTAIRSLMSFGLTPLQNKDFSSLQILGSVGEPINEEAWEWFYTHIGQSRCPIVDTWWQTETGGIAISNLAGVTPQKPSFATLPLPGIHAVLLDDHGREITETHVNGQLCIKGSWPSIIRTTYGDHDRCKKTYFSQYPGYYFTGDGAFRNEDGFYRISGRIDDVLKISGHRIGTAEVENAINMHDDIVESAVVGFPHEVKGQGIYAFVVHESQFPNPDMIRREINQILSHHIGPIAKADKIQFVIGLPKTRSGKIMRRILRKIAEGEIHQLGDTTTLLDPSIVNSIIEGRIS